MGRINKEHIQHFYDHNIDISTKTLYFGFGESPSDVELDHKLASEMIKGIHILSHIRTDEPINILMNCSGGDVDHGLAIYDAIRSAASHVRIIVMGQASSMAAWVLQAADERIITPSSYIMIHDGAGTKNKFARKQDKYCRDILLERIQQKNPGYSVHKLQKMLDTDTYLDPKEALELGLVDSILGEGN